MASMYDAALAALYQAPHRAFVAERNRLAAELKSAGDRAGAARLRARRRPPLSAWAVNQLYWRERGVFDALLHAAERLRAGDLSTLSRHRNALAYLREQAAVWLAREGHAATNATLERVTTTLAALAAAGTFDPDPPGALSADRDPTGFDFAPRVVARGAKKAPPKSGKRVATAVPSTSAKQREQAESARERARAEADAKRRREALEVERRRVAASLRDAEIELAARVRELDRSRRELARAEAALDRTRAAHEELVERLAELTDEARAPTTRAQTRASRRR